VVNVDRIRTSITRSRLHAVSAGAAFALLAGLAISGGTQGTTNTMKPVAHSETVKASTLDSMMSAVTAAAAPAAPAAPAPAPAPAAPAAPTNDQLFPLGLANAAPQQTFVPSAEQMRNAQAIVDSGKAMNLPPRAWVIAIATALQESGMHNIGDLGANNDHDSLGLFQQRPSSGWGSPDQIMNPNFAASSFYKGLTGVANWASLPLTDAAQKVQVSAFPDHYAKHEAQAGDMIKGLYGVGPYAGIK